MIERLRYDLPTIPIRDPAAPVVSRQITYAPSRREVWAFGGYENGGSFPTVDELWRYRLDYPRDGWQRVYWTGAGPAGRWGHLQVWDSKRGRLTLFTGSQPSFVILGAGSGWRLDPDALVWEPVGYNVAGRFSPAGWYDPVRDRIVLFGGTAPHPTPTANHVELDPDNTVGGWSAIPVSTAPPARYAAVSAWDPQRAAGVVAFGAPDDFDDAWVYDAANTTWVEQQIAGDARPPGRRFSQGAYSAALGGIVVYGGSDSAPVVYHTDTWLLTAERWRRLYPSAALPHIEAGSMAPHRDGVVLHGGVTQPGNTAELRTWVLGRDEEWAEPEIGLEYDPTAVQVSGSASLIAPGPTSDELISDAVGLPLASIESIISTHTIPAGDSLLYALDLGAGPIYWDSVTGKWLPSDLTAAEMSAPSDVIANVGDLPVGPYPSVILHARLISGGVTSPTITQIEITGDPAAVPFSEPRKCRIHGPILDLDGSPGAGAKLEITGPAGGFFHGALYLSERLASAEADASGQVSIEVYETETISQTVTIAIELGDGQRREATAQIPDRASATLEELLA